MSKESKRVFETRTRANACFVGHAILPPLAVGWITAAAGEETNTSLHFAGPDDPKSCSDRQEWRAFAEGLEPYSLYRFRVRAVNDVGAGEWSTTSEWARTNPSPTADLGLELADEEERLPGTTAFSGVKGL